MSKEEAEKLFGTMDLWLMERTMTLRNVTLKQDQQTIEADIYPEKNETAGHAAPLL